MIGWLHPAHPAPPPSPHRKVALTRLAGRCCRQPDDVPRGVLQVSMAQQGRLHVRLIQARNLAFHTGVLSAFHTLVRCCSGSSPLRTCACARACARAPAHATEIMRQPLRSQKRPHFIHAMVCHVSMRAEHLCGSQLQPRGREPQLHHQAHPQVPSFPPARRSGLADCPLSSHHVLLGSSVLRLPAGLTVRVMPALEHFLQSKNMLCAAWMFCTCAARDACSAAHAVLFRLIV